MAHLENATSAESESSVDIEVDDISGLLDFFLSSSSIARTNSTLADIQKRCTMLIQNDYETKIIPNTTGELCAHYPPELVLLQRTKPNCYHNNAGCSATTMDEEQLYRQYVEGRFARTRSRFPVPVILYKHFNICRSATLARSVEIKCREGQSKVSRLLGLCPLPEEGQQKEEKGQKAVAVAVLAKGERKQQHEPEMVDSVYHMVAGGSDVQDAGEEEEETSESKDSITSKYRQLDIAILKAIGVGTICDLMVEDRKVKFGFTLTSSEKADVHNRYHEFNIAAMPYPGVEWFKGVRHNTTYQRKVEIDWTLPEMSVRLNLPQVDLPDIQWEEYRSWDLVLLTQNYLKYMIKCLQQEETTERQGLLVHCISGWDRTPLFISLLRLSLWADGVIHQSLSAKQMLYLTVGYDWLLFGHLLSNRLSRGEEIFLFCFDFLQHITGSEFAVTEVTEEDRQSTPQPPATTPSPTGFATNAAATPNLSRDESFADDLMFVGRGEGTNDGEDSLVDDDDEFYGTGAHSSMENFEKASPSMAIPIALEGRPRADSLQLGESWQVVSLDSHSPNGTENPLAARGRNNASVLSLGSNVSSPRNPIDQPKRHTTNNKTKLQSNKFSRTRREERLHKLRGEFFPLYINAMGGGGTNSNNNSNNTLWNWMSTMFQPTNSTSEN